MSLEETILIQSDCDRALPSVVDFKLRSITESMCESTSVLLMIDFCPVQEMQVAGQPR